MLTVPEVADRIGRTQDAIRKAIRKGTLKAIRRGDYLIAPEEADRYDKVAKRGRPRTRPHQDAGKEGSQ